LRFAIYARWKDFKLTKLVLPRIAALIGAR